MRLLNTRTLELQEFHALPEYYAILSHTWGMEEVTYQHLIAGTGRQCHGWKKLEGACALAANDGWDFLWMDTCCIDKTDNVDLSEAINSMYKWYQASSICYAYLEDVELVRGVPVSSVALTHYDQRKSFEKILCRLEFKQVYGDVDHQIDNLTIAQQPAAEPKESILSRWFTRGWTLQELIAPRFLLFLDKSWCNIGGRMRWASQIEAMTAIDRRYFSGQRSVLDKNKCPAATKLGWASLRSTSRPEDRIYCLFGLLNVNMPLMYGEGTQAAFHRLQRKIIKHSDDESILAWQLPTLASTQWDNILAPELEFFQWLTDFRCQHATYELELHPFDADRDEFTMTNKGLKGNVPLVEVVTDRRQDYIGSDAASLYNLLPYEEVRVHYLQLNCWLRSSQQPPQSWPLSISLARDPLRKEVFVRKEKFINYDKIFLQLDSIPEPRPIYLKYDASLRYSPGHIPRNRSWSIFKLETSSDISIRDDYLFEKLGLSRLVSDPPHSLLDPLYGLHADECVFINAAVQIEGQSRGFWVFLSFFDASPWVTLTKSLMPEWLVIERRLWQSDSRARTEPGPLITTMMSSKTSIGYRAELVLEQVNARIIAQLQPRQPDAWECGSSSRHSHHTDNFHLLRLTWTTTLQEPRDIISPVNISSWRASEKARLYHHDTPRRGTSRKQHRVGKNQRQFKVVKDERVRLETGYLISVYP